MTDAHRTLQSLDVSLAEYIANESIGLSQVEMVLFTGDYSGGILTAMLQDEQAVIQHLGDVAFRQAGDSDDAAHRLSLDGNAAAVGIW